MSYKIIAISDNHGKLDFTIPTCDLLLHAGDVCPDFAPGTTWGSGMQEGWLNSKWLNWLDEQPVQSWVGTLGNHDFAWKGGVPSNFKIDELWTSPLTGLKIWLSPWSNTFGGWAWMAHPDTLAAVYANIPAGVDIIISHQPPYGYGDQLRADMIINGNDPSGHVGSRELLNVIDNLKPKVVVCGHIHSSRGVYERNGTKIYNCSMVDEAYKRIYEPVEIDIDGITS